LSILEAVLGLLVTPNPDDPLVASIAETYQNNRFLNFLSLLITRKLFDKAAKEHVKKYAM
jgi:ubiquitin-protein ligase